MKIFYVHHAERNKGNPPTQEDDITSLGIKDAKLTAKLFETAKNKGFNISAIYTSNYFRCVKTAKIINKKLNVPIILEPRFNEFKNIAKFSDGETWESCQQRILDAIKDIVIKHDNNDCVICVTSGVNITAFICAAFNIKPNGNLPFPIVPSCSPIGFEIDKNKFLKEGNKKWKITKHL